MSYLNVYFDDIVFVKVYPLNCPFIDLVRQYKMLCQDETSGIVDRGEDISRNFEKVEQEGALTPPYLGKVYFRSRLRGKG